MGSCFGFEGFIGLIGFTGAIGVTGFVGIRGFIGLRVISFSHSKGTLELQLILSWGLATSMNLQADPCST